MSHTLQMCSGQTAGTKYSLEREEIRMGRHPDCEVQIELNAVSRFHARLLRQGSEYVIEDLQSRNGTFVNGKKIEGPTLLKDKDRVKICDTLMVFHRATPDKKPEGPKVEEEEGSTTVLSSLDAAITADKLSTSRPESKLRAILEINHAMGQTLQLDDLFPKMLDGLFKIFPQADRGLIILRDDRDNLIPTAAKHRRADQDTVRFSRTIVRQAMGEKKALLSADASSDSRFALSQSISDFRIRSVMCAPLLTQEADPKPLGVIQLDSQGNNQKFEMDDLQILLGVAGQASIAVENAQMHGEMMQQARIKKELEFAREVQRGFLPKHFPKIAGYNFWAFYEAAGAVGGDFYDFVRLPNGRLGVILGDVSGKGVPAALMMAKASSDTKVALLTCPGDPAEAMGMINNAICDAGVEDKFITMCLCLIDPVRNTMTVVNAGHMSPIVRRTDGSMEEPAGDAVSGLPVGVAPDYPYEAVEVDLGVGDSVVLYSDGISEAMNAQDDQYTIERIRARMETPAATVAETGERVIEDVREHVNGYKQSDDMTLVLFGRT